MLLLYVIDCIGCLKKYIGQTSGQLKDYKFTDHKQNSKKSRLRLKSLSTFADKVKSKFSFLKLNNIVIYCKNLKTISYEQVKTFIRLVFF